MTVKLVDTHAHLDGEDFADDRDAVVRRAAEAAVAAIVSAGQDEQTSRENICLAERYPEVKAAAGVHPHRANDAGDLAWLPGLLRSPLVVAVGECGLDYHYDFSPRPVQRDIFARQLEIAAESGLPCIIHMRESEDDVRAMLRAHYAREKRAVVHCFTGGYDLGKALMDEFDVYLGIGGAVTFKKAEALHDAAARLPIERLVLETDCPFMTPAPHRGKRNEPALITLTVKRLADLRGTDAAAIGAQTTANAMALFSRLV